LSTDVSEVRTASIIMAIITLMMETGRTSETSVHFKETTWHYIPEGYHLDIEKVCLFFVLV
jgi:hypothetical protein